MDFYQADAFWFAKYVPSIIGYLRKMEDASGKLHVFIRKKIAEAQERLDRGDKPFDFIGYYLAEIPRRDDKLENG